MSTGWCAPSATIYTPEFWPRSCRFGVCKGGWGWQVYQWRWKPMGWVLVQEAATWRDAMFTATGLPEYLE